MPKRLLWEKVSGRGDAFHLVRVRLKGRRDVGEHTHDFPEVFWVEEGCAIHHANGTSAHLEPGDLVFIRSQDRHRFEAVQERGFVLVNLAFPDETLDFLQGRYFPNEQRWFWSGKKEPARVHLSADRLGWLRRWVARLDAARRSRLEVEVFLLELLRELQEERTEVGFSNGPEWLMETLRHLGNPAVFAGGTPTLAQLAGRTSQHLNATMKKFLGLTATEAINRARMEYAACQLRTSTKKILEICFDCGFQNLAHFYRLFGEFAGMTPRTYRLRHQQLLR